jgi:hypothetical protein
MGVLLRRRGALDFLGVLYSEARHKAVKKPLWTANQRLRVEGLIVLSK